MPDKNDIILEACVETLTEAISAERNGADRLELCCSLELDGLTPSIQLAADVLAAVHIPVKVMIRCRSGTFEYSESELQTMESQMRALGRMNIAGFVFGALRSDTLDIGTIRKMSQVVPEVPITVHKAIDYTHDPIDEARQLLDIPGVNSILTSGGGDSASRGSEVINAIYDAVNPQIAVIAAGKITHSNLSRLKEAIKVQEYHGRRIVGSLKP